MADKYANFSELAKNEVAGVDYGILLRRESSSFAIVTPHGGGIEPGTSEIASATAGEDLSFYAFEGLKSKDNTELHITSTRFDEPLCLALLKQSEVVITIHGEHSEEDGAGVFIGGRDERLGRRIAVALRCAGFPVGKHKNPNLQGKEENNICNRGRSGKGVQLELSKNIREQMFSSLSRKGRQTTKPLFRRFFSALRSALN
jgi:phage replication-related protein YjqB (UPF0714/DUF867 family)